MTHFWQGNLTCITHRHGISGTTSLGGVAVNAYPTRKVARQVPCALETLPVM